jgi:hypothetical protein
VEKILLNRLFPDEVIYREKFYRQKSTALLLNRKEEKLKAGIAAHFTGAGLRCSKRRKAK